MKNYLFLILPLVVACNNNPTPDQQHGLTTVEIPSPAEHGGSPNLHVSEDGQVILTWVEYLNDSLDALVFSRLNEGNWTELQAIDSGSNWFVNWADVPSLVTFNGKSQTMAAHWLQKSADGTYDYDVRISLSQDSGVNWDMPFIPHRDSVSAEHGFVTMLPLDNGRVFAVWLDGRNTKGSHGHGDSHGHHGAMTLRAAEFDGNGELFAEMELDDRVCDCCQTDAALTDTGPIVVYRDRSNAEVRDISVVRRVNGIWTDPSPVATDNWEITGCPVNGPAIASEKNVVAVAWFSGAEETNQVNVAFSKDHGESFGDPIRIDKGDPIGRVDLVFSDSESVVVSWVEQTVDGAEIRLAQVTSDGIVDNSNTVSRIGASRKSGFPILEKSQDGLILVWTAGEPNTTLRTVSIKM